MFARGGRLAKLAGILVEGRPQEGWAVLGIGVNVAVRVQELPVELRDTAASLGLASEEIEPLLARLLVALQRRLGGAPAEALDAWRARDALRGREISGSGGGGSPMGSMAMGAWSLSSPTAGTRRLTPGRFISRWTRSLRRILGDPGAIAQLGERLLCKQEVTGSIPVGSTGGSACKLADLAGLGEPHVARSQQGVP